MNHRLPTHDSARHPAPSAHRRLAIAAAVSILVSVQLAALPAEDAAGARTAGPGLGDPAFRPLPLGSIRADGWLQRQLRIQADGLTGHLDEFWNDVAKSGWIGGNAEGWERMPYWLDGFVPLAYLLDDPALEEKASRHVGAILERQQADGWLGPEVSAVGSYKPRDPWPVFVMLKVLTQYHEATGDARVPTAMSRFFRCLAAQLEKRPLFEWNRMRWQDGVLTVHWLYDRTGEAWLLDLARKMRDQGYDWKKHFADLPYKEKVTKWEHESHVVNNAMGVKAAAVWLRQSGDPGDRKAALAPIESLDRHHGQAAGIFSGDECFAGRMPSQGTETCAVVEYLFSLEMIASVLGDAAVGDRIELVGFNALPAPLRPDMWTRQYDQQANQVVARISPEHVYTTNGPDSNVFGLETNYGCCTANLHQGWPKLVSHLWMRSADGGLAVVAYAPSRISTSIGGASVRIEVKTDYPFGESIELRVSTDRPVRFPLHLRVPSWAKEANLTVEGAPPAALSAGAYRAVEREWSGTTSMELRFPMQVRLERRYNDAVTVRRGPLVFSLRIGTEWRKVRGEDPHADWEAHPTSPWNYALRVDEAQPDRSFQLVTSPPGTNPFDPASPPVRLVAEGRRLPGWTLERNAAAPPPKSPVASPEPIERVELIPYGTAKLRVTEFPTLRD